MVLADLPEASGIRHRRRAFVHQHRRATSERTVADVAVTGDPADIGGTPEHIVVTQIEHPLATGHGAEQIAGTRMLDALRLAGGTGGVEQEQRMFGLDPFGFAALGLRSKESRVGKEGVSTGRTRWARDT